MVNGERNELALYFEAVKVQRTSIYHSPFTIYQAIIRSAKGVSSKRIRRFGAVVETPRAAVLDFTTL